MKRFTLLITALCLFSVASWAQVMTQANKKHTLAGNVSEVVPYSTGFIYISNDGTNDVVSYSTDGVTFTDIENLEIGTAKGLSGWDDSDMAFYLGNNTSDGVGVEIRKFDGTSAGYFFNHNPLSDPNQGLITSVGRYFNGTSFEYHYLYQTGVNFQQAPQVAPSYTDGTDSYEISASNFGAQGLNIYTGKMFDATFNGNYYYAAQDMGNSVAGLYTLNNGSMELIYSSDDPWANIYGLTATSQNLYFFRGNYGDQGSAMLFATDVTNSTSVMSDGSSELSVDDAIEMQVMNDKLYVISLNNNLSKLTQINGSEITYYHLNAEGESDNIIDMVVSGNYVYVLAAKTDGNTQLYTINPALAEPVYAESSSLSNDMAAPRDLIAINGGVAFVSNNGSSDVVYISDGNDGNTNSLMTNGATLSVAEMISAGGKLYIFSENGTDTEIWEHMVMPFGTKTVTVTVLEKETQAPFANAQVTFDTGLETYIGTTDANGQVVLDNVPFGWLDAMVDVPSGYADIKKQQYIGAYSLEPTYEISVASSFGVLVHDNTIMQPADPTVQNATIELVDVYDATIVYTADVTDQDLGVYFASFTDVAYGTYNATVFADGYVKETVEFIVDETTATSNNILYVAPIQYSSFGVLVHDNTVMQPADPTVQNATIELVDVNDANIVYSADVIDQDLGVYFASFTDVPHGTYNATVYAEGYVVETVEFIVDETTATSSNILYVAPIQYSSFGVLVHDNTVMQPADPTVQNATIELVDVNDANIVYTANVIEQELGDYFASFADVPHGIYNATVTASGFVTATVEFIVDETTATSSNILYVDPIPTSIDDEKITKLKVYPNPAVDFIVFESANAIQSVEIYSVNGAKVKALNNDKITRINISELPKGLYLVATTDSNGQRQITKINKR